MLKSLIPALTVALLGNTIATAQYFGPISSTPSGYSQTARPMRIARATDTEPLAQETDGLDDLDALDSLDLPSASDLPQVAPIAPTSPLDRLDALEPPASLLDLPEQLELPIPMAGDAPAPSDDSNITEPEISAQDLEVLQPSPEPRSILEPSSAPLTPLPGPINFDDAIEQQQRDLAHPHHHTSSSQYSSSSQYYGATHHAGFGGAAQTPADCGCAGQPVGGCGSSLTPLAYRAPLLPPSNSFHGQFRADPCHYDLWANYTAEAAAACARNRGRLAPPKKADCRTCELVDPCPCR